MKDTIKMKIPAKLIQLIEFCLATIVGGTMFQLISDKTVGFEGPTYGVALGIGFWVIEFFIFHQLKDKFLKFPIMFTVFLKGIVYVIIIFLVMTSMALGIGLLQGLPMEDFYEFIVSKDLKILIGYVLLLYIFLSFYVQLSHFFGEGVLFKFLIGKYRKPIKEDRIFMFLDLKSSTSLAEKLGLETYYDLLNDFFHEITEPVNSTKAEIYQYVGDEVVFTWKTEEGLMNQNCLNLFFKIKEKVENNREYYLEKYGEVPQFKAGIHFGEVIAAQIGDVKRELVYNGDVLNTGARIQEKCNKLESEFLISGTLLNRLKLKNKYLVEKLENTKLRGKEISIDIFSVNSLMA